MFFKSEQLLKSAKKVIPGGVTSSVRASAVPVPLFFSHGAGSKLWDVDANEYIDFLLAYGPSFLGHAPELVVEALIRQAKLGLTFGAAHEGEQQAAQLILKAVPQAEQVVFSQTGSEAVSTALRIARSFTGRSIILKFQGHYHGWLDGMFASVGNAMTAEDGLTPVPQTSGIPPSAAGDVMVCPWNDVASIKKIFDQYGSSIAAVIVEPVNVNSGVILPTSGFLQEIRELTKSAGALLIFDEVITGFRLALGGSQELFQIEADLAIYAKAIAGGFPLSVVAGKAEFMDVIASGKLLHNGTFNGNPMGCQSVIATLTYLINNSTSIYPRLNSLGERLADGLQKLDQRLSVRSIGPICYTSFGEPDGITQIQQRKQSNNVLQRKFVEGLVSKGIYTQGLWYLSTAHSESDIDQALNVAELVLKGI